MCVTDLNVDWSECVNNQIHMCMCSCNWRLAHAISNINTHDDRVVVHIRISQIITHLRLVALSHAQHRAKMTTKIKTSAKMLVITTLYQYTLLGTRNVKLQRNVFHFSLKVTTFISFLRWSRSFHIHVVFFKFIVALIY